MLIYLLLILLIVICGNSYILSKKDVFSPPVVFSGIFIVSSLIAIPNLKVWNFDMGIRTFSVILLGVFSFVVGYYGIYFLRKKFSGRNELSILISSNTYIRPYKLIIIFFIQLITIYLLYRDISLIANNMGGGYDLSEKIFLYRTNLIVNNSEEGQLSFLAQHLKFFCKVFSYFLMYKLLDEYFCYKKIKIKYIFLIIIGVGMTFLTGARGEFVFSVIYFGILFYVFWKRKNCWRKNCSLKNIFIILISIAVAIMVFSSIGLILLGREEQLGTGDLWFNIWQQISMYVAAPLKLLDLYMYTDFNTEKLPLGIVTFKNIYSFLGRRFDIESWQVPLLLGSEFRRDNGAILGNVYTAFRTYLIDFGYLGVIVLPLIMGIILAYLYFSIIYKKQRCVLDYNIIIYVFCYMYMMNSFFIESFYRSVFSFEIIEYLIYYKLIEKLFLTKK